MSWLPPVGDVTWAYRAAVTVDASAGVTGSLCWSLELPTALDLLWLRVAADAADVRVTEADGVTAVDAFQLDTWSQADRTGVLAVQSSRTATGALVYWLYWGAEGAEAAASNVELTSPLSAALELARPAVHVVTVRPEQVDAGAPRSIVTRLPAEEGPVWFDFAPAMSAQWASARSAALEELSVVQVELRQAGSPVESVLEPTLTRIVGPAWAGVWVGPADEGSYLLVVRVRTSIGRLIEGRAVLQILDPVEG